MSELAIDHVWAAVILGLAFYFSRMFDDTLKIRVAFALVASPFMAGLAVLVCPLSYTPLTFFFAVYAAQCVGLFIRPKRTDKAAPL